MMSRNGEGQVQATVTANDILDCVTQQNGANLTEIASELDIATSTVHRHVNTLLELGFLVKDGKQYLLGFRYFKYASTASSQFPIVDIACEELDRVSEITNEHVALYIERDDRLYELLRSSNSSTDHIRDGKTEPLYTTAPGKSLLAYENWEDVRSLRGIEDGTIDLDKLREELRQIRMDEFAIERDESIERTRVATPIRLRGDAVASICVSGPIRRLSGKRLTEDIPGLLRNTSKTIEVQLLST